MQCIYDIVVQARQSRVGMIQFEAWKQCCITFPTYFQGIEQMVEENMYMSNDFKKLLEKSSKNSQAECYQ